MTQTMGTLLPSFTVNARLAGHLAALDCRVLERESIQMRAEFREGFGGEPGRSLVSRTAGPARRPKRP